MEVETGGRVGGGSFPYVGVAYRGGWLAFVVVAALVRAPTSAEEAAPSNPARALLDHVRHLNETTRAWTDRTQRLDLTIVDRRKNERHREMKIETKKYDGDETRTILFFLAPPEVRGVGLLQWSKPHEEDTQWLRLPELERPRRISGSGKRESFVGTDFSYEDLSIWAEILDWTDADAKVGLLRDEPVETQPCAVIEMVPVGADVSYEKIRVWLGREDWVIHRMEFDHRAKTVKRLDLTDVRRVGDIPVAHRLVMHNLRGGSSTSVVFTDIEYDTRIADEEFTQRRLEKGI